MSTDAPPRFAADQPGTPSEVALSTTGPAQRLEPGAATATTLLSQLGLEPDDAMLVRRSLAEPLGIVLAVGPRNSGLTTSVRALVQETAAAQAGHGDDAAPPVVLDPPVGAAVAIRAFAGAAAGRRVIASAHLERAAHVFGHFQQRGMPPAQLARDLLLVIGQQRVRRLCAYCRQADHSPDVRAALAQASNSWFAGAAIEAACARPGGCHHCAGTGHAGHALAYELLPVDSGVRALAEQNLIGLAMEQALFGGGRSLWSQGLRLVARGRCSLAALRAAVREPR